MSELEFSNNFSDLSVQHGVNAGFQFDFSCQHCGDKFRSNFVPFRTGQATGWLSKAASIFGGALGQAGSVADGLSESGYGKAHDEALKNAIVQAKGHYHRCARCTQHVCITCWNKQKGLCLSCAPSVESEVEAARNAGEIQAATENAAAEGVSRGKKIDVKRDRQLVCPKCDAETKGAKFCPECGEKMAVLTSCGKCQSAVEPGVKFCPECGNKM